MKKKIISICTIVTLLGCILAGTLAYFTDTDEAQNTFSMGNVDIKLDEAPVVWDEDTHTWVADPDATDAADRVQENEYTQLYPGAVVDKDPTVWNEGDYDTYIRVKVSFPVVSDNAQKDFADVSSLFSECVDSGYVFPTSITADNLDKVLVGFDKSKWTVEQTQYAMPFFGQPTVGETMFELTFTYKEKLPADGSAVLFEQVQIPKGIETGFNDLTMFIVAEAIQADGFSTVTEAFAAYDAENA